MNLIELNQSLRQLRLSGMSAVLETRLLQAQAENIAPIDLVSMLVSDELACRTSRQLERRHKQAQFRDQEKRLDNFDFQFNARMNRSLIFDMATAAWVGRRQDALLLGPPGSGKSHIAQAIGHAVIQQGYRVLYREAHLAAGRTGRCHAGWKTQRAYGSLSYCSVADQSGRFARNCWLTWLSARCA